MAINTIVINNKDFDSYIGTAFGPLTRDGSLSGYNPPSATGIRHFFPIQIGKYGRITSISIKSGEIITNNSYIVTSLEYREFIDFCYVYDDGTYSEVERNYDDDYDGLFVFDIPEGISHLCIYMDGAYTSSIPDTKRLPFYVLTSFDHTVESNIVSVARNIGSIFVEYQGVRYAASAGAFSISRGNANKNMYIHVSDGTPPGSSDYNVVLNNSYLITESSVLRQSKNKIVRGSDTEYSSPYASFYLKNAETGLPQTEKYVLNSNLAAFALMIEVEDEPEYYEVTRETASSVSAINTDVSIAKKAVIEVTSSINSITSTSSINVFKDCHSHVEGIMTSLRKEAEVVTSTKGNRISCNAFVRVKTSSSTLVRTIESNSVRTAKAHFTANHHMQKIESSAIELNSVDRFPTSTMKPLETSFIIRKQARVTVKSTISRIGTHVKAARRKVFISKMLVDTINTKSYRVVKKTKDQPISFVSPIQANSERSITHKLEEANSHLSTIETGNIIFRKKEVVVSSHVETIHSSSQVNASPCSNSHLDDFATKNKIEVVKNTSSHLAQIESMVIRDLQINQVSHIEQIESYSFSSKRVKNESVSSYSVAIQSSAISGGIIHVSPKSHVKTIHSSSTQHVAVTRTVSSHVENIHSTTSRKVVTPDRIVVSKIRKVKTSAKDQDNKNVSPISIVKTINSRSRRAAKVVRNVVSHVASIDTNSSMSYMKLPRISIVTSTVGAIKVQTDTAKHKVVQTKKNSFMKKINSNASLRKGFTTEVTSTILPVHSHAVLGISNSSEVTSSISPINTSVEIETKFISTATHQVKEIHTSVVSETRTLKMSLHELKARLEIPQEDTESDEELLTLLHDALDFVERTCDQTFDPLPPTVKRVMIEHVKNAFDNRLYVLSESIGGMSQSFESSNDIEDHLYNTLRRAGLIKLHFSNKRG